MSIVKISDLPAADSPVSPSDVAPVVQNGVTKKASLNQLGFLPAGSAAITRTIQNKLRDVVSVLDFGADPTGVLDSTAAFTAALAAANQVFVPNGEYRINGTVSIPEGATLYGETNVGDYFVNNPFREGTRLFKDTNSANGPIIVMKWSSGIHHLQLVHLKSGGATEGIIKFDDTAIVTYASIDNVHIFGSRTTDTTGSTTCYGIKLVGSPTTSRVMFFNRVTNCTITECDVGIFLGPLANANVFTSIVTRECHVHYELKGSSSFDALENTFTSLGLFSISSTLSPQPICFKLTEYAKNNIFSGYVTETYGREFSPSAGVGNSGNIFLGASNEFASWTNQLNLRYAAPINVDDAEQFYFTDRTTNDRNVVGQGAKYYQQFQIAGDMPQANDNAGTFSADSNSKVIFRFNTNFFKNRGISFRCSLKVFAYGPFGTGMHMADVDFLCRVTSTVTPGSYSAELCVNNAVVNGDRITGVHFLTGVAASLPYGIGITCGNYGSFAIDNLRCFLEYEALDFATNTDFFDSFVGLSSTTSATPTANDVTDAIDLLTVANTAF